mmetsp:Transcript_5217/g.7836  ORF Transcript_5217/g.7836 Transcript_5217/m.7836 type:complete len:130 (-) Transcript_5217:1613-2002(-)
MMFKKGDLRTKQVAQKGREAIKIQQKTNNQPIFVSEGSSPETTLPKEELVAPQESLPSSVKNEPQKEPETKMSVPPGVPSYFLCSSESLNFFIFQHFMCPLCKKAGTCSIFSSKKEIVAFEFYEQRARV